MAYCIKKITKFDLPKLICVSRILKESGDDMFFKYQLSHWKNSFIKTFLIVIYTSFRNTLWGCFENQKIVATFQTRNIEEELCFSKFAVHPLKAGKGIGSYCLKEMEQIAIDKDLRYLRCDVYNKNRFAYDFYIKKGFIEAGEIKTLKYTEITLKKCVGN